MAALFRPKRPNQFGAMASVGQFEPSDRGRGVALRVDILQAGGKLTQRFPKLHAVFESGSQIFALPAPWGWISPYKPYHGGFIGEARDRVRPLTVLTSRKRP